MQRVLILGCSGSGKSTFAVALGARLRLPVVHLDTHYWRSGWIETPKAEWGPKVTALLQGERWIMDGNFAGTLAERLAACDTAIFLARSRLACLWRILKRRLIYHGRTRPDLPENCPERFDWEFYRWVWRYPRDVEPTVLSQLREAEGRVRVVILKSDRAVAEFLAKNSP